MAKKNPENPNQGASPEEVEALQQEAGEAVEAEKSPEQIIDGFETKTRELKTTREEYLQSIESAKKSKEDYERFGLQDERVQELNDFIAEREKLIAGLSEEITRRGLTEAEIRAEGEIDELDNRIAVMEKQKAQVGLSAYPERERAEIDSRIAGLQAERERCENQLQSLQLKRIHQYQTRKNLLKGQGIYTEVQARDAAKQKVAQQELRREKLKESAAQAVEYQREKEAAMEAKEVIKKDKWGWAKKAFRVVAPAGIYAFVKERRAVAATGRDIAAQLKAQEQLALAAIGRPEKKGLYSGFKSERAQREELTRIKEALNIRSGSRTRPEQEILQRFNEVRGDVSRDFVGENEKLIDGIVDRAVKVLTSKMGTYQERYGRGRVLEGADLEQFKAELRKRLETAQNDQLVRDTKAYARLVKEALNADSFDREVFQPLQEVAGEAAAAA